MSIVDCPKLKKIEIGKECLKSLDTFRISELPALTTLFIGDDSFDDEASRARVGNCHLCPSRAVSSKEEALTSKLDCKYKNKSLVLYCTSVIGFSRSSPFPVFDPFWPLLVHLHLLVPSFESFLRWRFT